MLAAFTGVQKVVGAVRNVADVPQEVAHIARVVDGMEPAVQLATRLQARHATSQLVGPAVLAVSEVLQACEAALTDVPRENARDEAGSGWGAWLTAVPADAAKRGLRDAQRSALLPRLRAMLNEAGMALQLALQAVALDAEGAVRRGVHPVSFVPDAVEAAQAIFFNFAAGRIPVNAATQSSRYPLCLCHAYTGPKSRGPCGLVLERSATDGAYALVGYSLQRFAEVDVCDDDESEAETGSVASAMSEDVAPKDAPVASPADEVFRVAVPVAAAPGSRFITRVQPTAAVQGAFDQFSRQQSFVRYVLGTTFITFEPLVAAQALVPEFPAGGAVAWRTPTAEVFECVLATLTLLPPGKASLDEVASLPGGNATEALRQAVEGVPVGSSPVAICA